MERRFAKRSFRSSGPGDRGRLAKAGWPLDTLDLCALHEANLTLNDSIVRLWRERGFKGRVINAAGKFGNTTSASIPLALAMNPDELELGKACWADRIRGRSVSELRLRHDPAPPRDVDKSGLTAARPATIPGRSFLSPATFLPRIPASRLS
jgi:hypothetical protein